MAYQRVVFGGLGVAKTSGSNQLGQVSFNGRGETANPVIEVSQETREPIKGRNGEEISTATKEVNVHQEIEILTKSQLKQAIENKLLEKGLKYTKELNRSIDKLKRDDLEAYLNNQGNFISAEVKKINEDTEKKKAQAEVDGKTEKSKLIAEVLSLQVSKKEANPMSDEELNEMSLPVLKDYHAELSS